MQITREEFPDKIKFKEEIPNALANYDDDMMMTFGCWTRGWHFDESIIFDHL